MTEPVLRAEREEDDVAWREFAWLVSGRDQPAISPHNDVEPACLGVMGRTGFHDYDAAKAGLRSLTRGFAAELMPRSIRVNAVSPAGIKTSVIDRAPISQDAKAEMTRWMIDGSPMKRLGTVEEVAVAVEFLALHATYTTGAELPIDGGWSQL